MDRSTDRLIVVTGILLAAAFLAVAAGSLALPTWARRGLWLPLHLVLAGAATTAIAAVMPFFSAAFAAAPPANARLRVGSVVAVALGAALVAIGMSAAAWGVGLGGGLLFLVGLTGAAAATGAPLRGSLGPGRGLVTRAYLAAIAQVAIGAVLGTLFFAGWEPLLTAWSAARPAHAWLNLVGFVSLVIATTLVHFFPTVVGARIGRGRAPRAAIYGLAAGPLLLAAGYILALDAVVRLGALSVLAAAAGLSWYCVAIWRSRARWTTELSWHRFAIGGLWSAIVWFDLAVLVAAGRAIGYGAAPHGWATNLVAAPFVAGWVAMALVASATHLLPAVGPGGPAEHARQRRLLGTLAVPRLAALDVGVALLTVGAVVGADGILRVGGGLVVVGLASSIALLVGAVGIGLRTGTAPARARTGAGTQE